MKPVCKAALTSWVPVPSALPTNCHLPASRLRQDLSKPPFSGGLKHTAQPTQTCPLSRYPPRNTAVYPKVTAGKSQPHTDGTLPANTQCNGVEKPKLANRGEE